ncbi:MAG: DUF4159 domain-containing protein [Planctomycetes bacterium]|nr:DUF4159 domain-containing protein [Planctomycetota bacterium]
MKRRVLLVASVGAMLVAAASGSWAQEITDDQIDEAIRKGCEYIIGMQKDDGTWPIGKLGRPSNANNVMCMLALAYAEYPTNSEAMKKGIKVLIDEDLTTSDSQSYLTAFRMQACAKLLRQVDRETRELVLACLKKDAEAMVKGQTGDGGWGYRLVGGPTFADFSNVQICMLGLGEAVNVGLELPRETFLKAQQLYIDQQLQDGGWHYGRQVKDSWPWTTDQAMPSYGSMTAAGVASLYITRDYLYPGLGCPCRGGRSNYKENKVDKAIERGLVWLGERFTPKENPKANNFPDYWLYSCERVGLASGIKYFGKYNWYAEGATRFLAGQDAKGAWGHVIRDGNWNNPPGQAWAMLFLIKGRAPIIMNKLQFEGAWNLHPQDLKNLAAYVGNVKEQTFAWQVINLDAPVDEWHDSPILYITPESIVQLSDEHKQKLRKFTDDGGTIFFESSCGNSTVRNWWKAAAQEIWPEFEFRNIEKDHPVWTADAQMRGPLPGLMEMADGVRTFIFFALNDVSCAWNTTQVTKRADAFQFGINLYAYATDRAKIRSRLMGATQNKSKAEQMKQLAVGSRRDMAVARLKHGGDWNVSARYRLVEKLVARVNGGCSTNLVAAEPASPSDAALPQGALLYVTGRTGITLSDAEQQALKQRLAAGGFLLADACLGDERFQKAFKAFAEGMGWTLKQLPDDHPLVRGSMGAATGYDLGKGVKYTFHAVARAGSPLRLELHGIYAGDRLVGVYSPRDVMIGQAGLRAYGNIGYDIPSAQMVVENVLLYATAQ